MNNNSKRKKPTENEHISIASTKRNKITIFLCLIFFISFPGIEMRFAFISWWVITWRYQPPLVSKPSHPIRMLCSIQMNTNQWIEKMKLKPVLEKRSYTNREKMGLYPPPIYSFLYIKIDPCVHHTPFKAKKKDMIYCAYGAFTKWNRKKIKEILTKEKKYERIIIVVRIMPYEWRNLSKRT